MCNYLSTENITIIQHKHKKVFHTNLHNFHRSGVFDK